MKPIAIDMPSEFILQLSNSLTQIVVTDRFVLISAFHVQQLSRQSLTKVDFAKGYVFQDQSTRTKACSKLVN